MIKLDSTVQSGQVPDELVIEIRKAHITCSVGAKELARMFNVSLIQVKEIMANRWPYHDRNHNPTSNNDNWSIPKDQWHFHRRLWKRYGLILKRGEFQNFVDQTKDNHEKLVQKGVYALTHPDYAELIFVVRRNGHVKTALSPNAYKFKNGKWQKNSRFIHVKNILLDTWKEAQRDLLSRKNPSSVFVNAWRAALKRIASLEEKSAPPKRRAPIIQPSQKGYS